MVEVQAERLKGVRRGMELACVPCKSTREVDLDHPEWTDHINAFLAQHKACADPL